MEAVARPCQGEGQVGPPQGSPGSATARLGRRDTDSDYRATRRDLTDRCGRCTARHRGLYGERTCWPAGQSRMARFVKSKVWTYQTGRPHLGGCVHYSQLS